MDPLIGYIEYHLSPGCGHLSWSAKSDPDEEKDISDDVSFKVGRKRPYSSSSEEVDTRCGFYFIPIGYSERNFEYDEFHLILPQNLINEAIRSILLKSTITLTAYKISNFSHQNEIEVFTNGMVGKISNETLKIETLSLFDIQKMEKQYVHIEKKRKFKKLTLRARVDSISPIITAVPSDPFALVEVYDIEHDLSLTSVIVLRGQALLMHPVILPGMDLTLREVKRKCWHIPQTFQNDETIPRRLHQRAPTHVFVVEDPRNVVIQHDSKETFTSGVSAASLETRSFPSTLKSLTCIQGKITKVQDISSKLDSDLNHIHYIILESKMRSYKLYLTYFPIAPNCCNGFRVGAFIRAMNVHPLDSYSLHLMNKKYNGKSYGSYGACLRSTVVLVACRSEIENSLNFSVDAHTFKPLLFKDIRSTYHEYEWISLARKIFATCSVPAKTVQLTLEMIISDFGCRSRNSDSCSQRNAYMEWFDHGCETIYNNKIPDSNISMCGLQGNMPFLLSPVLSLSSIKKACLDRASNALLKHLSNRESNGISNSKFTSTERADIGWTSSLNIKAKELIPMSAEGQNCNLTNLFVGGIFNDSSEEGQATLSDGKCTISLSMHHLRESSKSVPFLETGNFMCMLISSIDVSLLYLGEYSGRSHSSDANERFKIDVYHLPKIIPNNNPTLEGPSNIVRVGDHYALVSSIINFSLDNIYAMTNSMNQHELCKQDHHIPSRFITENLIEENLDAYRYCRLIRQKWKVQKIRKPFLGCNLTVACSPTSLTYHEPYHQPCTIDISLRIPIDMELVDHFSNIQSMLPKEVLQLAFAWQYVAESRIGNIIKGGWDEKIETFDKESNFEHLLYISSDTLQMGRKLSLLDVSSLRVRTVKHDIVSWSAISESLSVPFTYFGGRNVLPGVLDLRIRRALLNENGGNVRAGEAIVPNNSIYGLPSLCVSQLQNSRLFSFDWESSKKIKIPNTQISTLRFCRARAECSRCYSALVLAQKRQQQHSFWDSPFPIDNEQTTKFFSETEHRTLKCPSGCHHRFQYIKWELSANISDGSGSAKVYTERDVAILLLGKGLNFDAIEAGAWESPEGMRYQVGSKLDPELRFDIAKAKNQIIRERLSVSPDMLLTRTKRAQYLLYKHCTSSQEIFRRMDFVCQVKKRASEKLQYRLYDIRFLSSLGDTGVLESSADSNFIPFAEFVVVDCYRSFDNTSAYAKNMLETLKRNWNM